MVSLVRGTGQILNNVDDFVLEDDFCKFWSVFNCGSRFVYYTICKRKRFLDVGDIKIPMLNLFVWRAAEFFPNIMLSFTKFWNCVSPISAIDLIGSNIKSGMTIESLCILCSFVDLNEFIGNSLDNVLMSKIQYIDQNFFHELIL